MATGRSESRSTRCEHLAMWLRDLRIAMRRLGRSPGFASASILTLALGTGAAGAVFSLVNAVLLRPLPWRQPETVALIWPVQPSGERTWLSFPELEDLRREGGSLAAVAGLTDLRPTFIADGVGYELQAVAVSRDLFRLLGVAPVLGRDFSRSDDQRRGAAVAILSDSFWRARFGADPTIVGRSIVLDARPCVVIGVLPPAFGILPPSSVLPDRVDVWLPLEQHLASRDRGVRFLHVLARVHGKADFGQAREELRRYAARARRQFASAYPGGVWQFTIVPFAEDVLKEARMSLRLLLALVGLVLLMACANVANLLLARGEARGTELAIRTALGASPARLAGELMAEALVLGACGSALGLALAAAAPTVLRAVDPGALPRLDDASVDGRVVAFMLAVALLTAAIFASVPLLERLRLRSLVVFGSARGGRTRRSAAAGRLLVLTQTALATTIIVLALFLTVTFNRLQRADMGFSRDHVLTARVSLSPPYSGAAAATRFFDAALEAASRVPGVVRAAAVTQLPLSGAMLGSTFLVGQGRADSPRIDADLRGITPRYLDVMGIPLVSGRAFDERDSAGGAPVAIVDESFARRMPGGGPVVGRRIRWLRQPDVEVEIVGVARAVRHRGAGIVPRETVYRPHWQYARASMYLAVRTRQDASGAASALRAAVASVDPSQPVADVATMSHRFERSISRSRTSVMLAGVLAGLALALALVGLYGVLSLGVAHRVLEFGVRMALGATPGAVQRLVLGEGLLLSAVGASAGAGTAAAMVRLFPGLWSGAGWSDVYTYVSGICLVMVGAAVAFWFPARQAGAIQPMVILKGD
jgi:putative ABC transport system permease protein